MTARRMPAFGVLAMSAAIVVAFATAIPVSAWTTVPVTHSCTGLGQTTTRTDDWQVDAPTSVASGGQFIATVVPPPVAVPTMIGASAVVSVKNIVQKITTTNATFAGGLSESGGSANLGTTSTSFTSNVLTLMASGPVPAGQSYQLPAISMTLTAGTAGTPATVTLSGHDWGWTTVIQSGSFTLNAGFSCVPVPDPTILASTGVTGT